MTNTKIASNGFVGIVTNSVEMSTVSESDSAMEVEVTASSSASNIKPAEINNSISTGKAVMASPGTIPSVTVSLHPLVIMNISEHWTRRRAQEGSPQQGNF